MICWLLLLFGSGSSALAEETPATVRPIADIRFDTRFDRLDNPTGEQDGDETSVAFVGRQLAFGLQAELSDWAKGRALFNVFEAHDQAIIEEGSSTNEEQTLERYPTGWGVRARDVYLQISPTQSDALRIRAGIQPTNFGSRGLFHHTKSGRSYYLVGPRTKEVAALAGLVHTRDLGVRADGGLYEGRVAWDVMLANGTGHAGGGEDNVAKDLAARMDFQVAGDLHVIGSVQRSVDGSDDDRSDLAFSTMLEWRTESLRFLGEYLSGVTDTADPQRFTGGQAAAALERTLGSEVVDRLVWTARWGYFDPRADTTDADAWMIVNASVQSWWAHHRGADWMTGLGYDVFTPMDVSQPVEHSAVLQVLWKL